MRRPAAGEKTVYREHMRVLAGAKTVEDMVVFLMYRKLKNILQEGTSHLPDLKEKENGLLRVKNGR